MQTETLMRMLGDLLARIATPAEFTLADDPAAFNKAMLSWLTDPDFRLPNGSVVGLCCSSLLSLQFREDADASTDDLMLDFRRFLLATSLAHAGWRDGSLKAIRADDLRAAGHISGARLFRRLGRVLTPQFLSRCGRDQCQVLFLLVLGAVLGVGYYSSSRLEDDRSPDFFPPAVGGMLSPELRRSPTLWLAMKEQLCQMLAHHLIFLGSMLEIKLEAAVEQRIIETAVARWNKAEDFVWADMSSSGFGVGEDRKEEGKEEEEEEEEERPPSTRTCKSPEVVRSEDVDQDSVLVQPSSSRVPSSHCAPASSSSSAPPPPPPAAARLPPLVTISLSELKQFHPESVDAWFENPQSYLSMFDDELGSTGERAASSASGAAPELTARQEGESRERFLVPKVGVCRPES
ncbi:hypothetical protein MYCTH_2307871 [Thermothelomyces thermophilus ATCC 42464]|uniref:Uncharacterized protein n=1 Tax=Thermothelomyces thermophilus (strain ATCC 42464 / BCRC 31852 / DSM 1799) TaxID=573729 RepID=G2QIH3_THET4|nr:uncharacterized protein MYCTH_2307871 [Thermothelomyces thermophilus ATCC 42464]AEO59505.1 hypothetical protein MYCTH_2307871 [Thermothelomyces thermophilus ATCC 42464]